MNGELIEFLNEKFNKIDQRFEKIDERFDKVDQRFEIESINMKEGFKEARIERQKIKDRLDRLYDAVDGFTKTTDTIEHELIATKEHVERLEQRVTNLENKFA